MDRRRVLKKFLSNILDVVVGLTDRPNELKPNSESHRLFHMSMEELLIKTCGITAAAIVVGILIYYTLKRKG